MLVSGYNNIILLPNCTMLYYVFSGPLSLRAYVPEIKFNNNNVNVHIFDPYNSVDICITIIQFSLFYKHVIFHSLFSRMTVCVRV